MKLHTSSFVPTQILATCIFIIGLLMGILPYPADANVSRTSIPVTPTFSITFDKTVVKTGVSLLPGTDVRGYVKVTVVPKTSAGQVTFKSTKIQRATVAVTLSRDEGNAKIIYLAVTGIAPTPSNLRGGDATLQALRNNVVVKSAPILVVYPKTCTHKVAAPTLENFTDPTADPRYVRPSTQVSAIVDINVKDQFGDQLDACYNGQAVVNEAFSEPQGTPFFGNVSGPIIYPDQYFANGLKQDQHAITYPPLNLPTTIVIPVSAAQDWSNFNLRIHIAGAQGQPNSPTSNNFFGIFDGYSASARQRIDVHGYHVTPDVRRAFTVIRTDYPPNPLTISDTPITPNN